MVGDLVEPAEGPAFHVVAPSLPGFGFSAPLSSPGWTMSRSAGALVELMSRLATTVRRSRRRHRRRIAGMVAGYDEEHVVGVHIVTDPMTPRTPRPSFPAWPTPRR